MDVIFRPATDADAEQVAEYLGGHVGGEFHQVPLNLPGSPVPGQPFNAKAQDAMANISSDSASAVHSAVISAERAKRE